MSHSELDTVYLPIKTELDAVYSTMKRALSDTDVGDIQDIVTHLMSSPGKQVRAAICLLSYHTLNGTNSPATTDIIILAAVIELIHLASLIHDDIIDDATTRRKIASVNAKFGSNSAIVVGVYVYAVALTLLSEIGRHDILKIISSTVKTLCEGELLQTVDIDTLTVDHYLAMIRCKTGILFESAAMCAALLADPNPPQVQNITQFGLNLGYIFQITDDYLDLFGSTESLGKEPGQDIVTGKITLPYIHLWHYLTEEEKKQLPNIRSLDQLKPILNMSRIHDVKQETERSLNGFIYDAKQQLTVLEASEHRGSLLKILDIVSERISS